MSNPLSKISVDDVSAVFKRVQKDDLIAGDDTSLLFYDLSRLSGRISNLIDLFPDSTLHAVAVKANPLAKILGHLCQLDVGAEVASLPELLLAESTGFRSEKIVFDSPAKTIEELEYALKKGIHINIDSFSELERIAELKTRIQSRSSIGIRLNPQVGMGKIAATSVAGEYSKFGISLKENSEALIETFLKHDWLNGIHLHIGSQGCSLEMLIKGIETVYEFVVEVNTRLKSRNAGHRINIFDIGGGLPVSYRQGDETISMKIYRDSIKRRFPELFSDKFKLITEFGRYIHANAGWVAARVEYVKETAGIKTAMIHVGADMFVRECYNPDDWHHDISVIDSRGNIKSGNGETYAVAGPLCFAGDIIAREAKLPLIEEGDYLIIHDAGAYTLSMWSRYNSRQPPKVIGYHDNGEAIEVLKKREEAEKTINFWD
ncbi:MAG: diaminopimelate decarboxylase [candidate division Zixibacteria bacterium]|nr:diaminopimelate decarboxylase [candidate division Zixibacteria bacterium]